jgi:hypothetical protein
MVRAVDLNNVPDYLRAVSFLKPSGNLVAEVGSAVDQMLARSVAWSIARRFAFYGAFAGLVASFLAFQNQLSLIGVDVLGVPPDCGLPIGIALMVSLRRSFQGIAQWRTLACFGLAIVGVLAAPHILRVYDADLTLYPDHPLVKLNHLAMGLADRGFVLQPKYLRDWSDNALHDIKSSMLVSEEERAAVPHSYVPVPVPVLLRYGAVSCAFGVIMIAGLAAIFARVPRWTVAIAGIVSAFAIGAASAVAVGLYPTSIFIAYDIAYDDEVGGELFRSLWSYPGLMFHTRTL